MKIVLLTSTFLPKMGGKEWVIHHLGNALADLGNTVTVVARRVSSAGKQLPERRYKLIYYGLVSGGDGRSHLTDVWILSLLAALSCSGRLNVLHAHDVDRVARYARLFDEIMTTPIVLTPHGQDIQKVPEIGYGERLDPAKEELITKNIQAADSITAISDSIKQDILDAYTAPRALFDIPNGIWVARYQSEVDRDAVRRRYGLGPEDFVVISVGRNHPKKGYALGVKALKNLASENNRIHYLIVGRETAHLIRIAGSDNRWLHLPGEMPQEEVVNLLKSSDLFISPSLVEGFPLATIEAMAAGLPIIATNVPGNREACLAAGGILVEPGSPATLISPIKSLIDNRRMQMIMGESSRRGAARYDWTNIAREYEVVYLEAIDHKRYKCARIQKGRYLNGK